MHSSVQSPTYTPPADSTLPAGTILNNSYSIRQPLGRGGFGITYLADENISGRLVVIKENFPSFCAGRDTQTLHIGALSNKQAGEYKWALENFENEARILTRLAHPNIVQILSIFTAFGTAYYVMPYISGTALHTAAPAPNEITEDWLRPILLDLLGALAYLHSNELLHRDIKPDNVLITAGGAPILIDFGTARTTQGNHTHTQVGTEGYAPLEQWAKGGKRGPWTDLYALGATCYRLITGTEPPDCHDRLEDDPYVPLSSNPQLRTRFSITLLGSIDKALNMSRHERWQTAGEWIAHLTANQAVSYFGTKGPKSAPPTTGKSRRSAGRKQKNKKNSLTITLLLAALAIPAAYVGYQQLAPRQQANKPETKLVTPQKQEPIAPDVSTPSDSTVLSQEQAQQELKKYNITSSKQYNSELLKAAKGGTPERLQLLINAGADIHTTDSSGKSAIHLAAESGNTECLKLLLNTPGIDVNVADEYDQTPLHWAAYAGKAECVKVLLNTPGIDIDRKHRGGAGHTPLRYAQIRNHEECALLLIKAGASISMLSSDGTNALHRAAKMGHSKSIQAILERQELDIDEKDENGATALDYARKNQWTECETLLRKHTNGNEQASTDTDSEPEVETIPEAPEDTEQEPEEDAEQDTPEETVPESTNKAEQENTQPQADDSEILETVKSGDAEKLKQLIDAGANINAADAKTGDTLLHIAAAKGDSACVKLLLSVDASVSAVNKKWRTPLTSAYESGFFSQVKELKDAHIREMKRMKLPTNAKHFPKAVRTAASKGEANKICMLYALDPNMELLVAKQGTAYHRAVEKDHPNCLLALQAYAPSIRSANMPSNTPDSRGRIPLLLALDLKRMECAKIIIEFSGAYCNVPDNKGRTPLSVATEKKYTEITNKLRAALTR